MPIGGDTGKFGKLAYRPQDGLQPCSVRGRGGANRKMKRGVETRAGHKWTRNVSYDAVNEHSNNCKGFVSQQCYTEELMVKEEATLASFGPKASLLLFA